MSGNADLKLYASGSVQQGETPSTPQLTNSLTRVSFFMYEYKCDNCNVVIGRRTEIKSGKKKLCYFHRSVERARQSKAYRDRKKGIKV